MRTTYVLRQSHIESFRNQHLQDQTYVFGTSIRNFDFSFTPDSLDTHKLEIDVFHAFQSLDLPILNHVKIYPQTIKDVIHFVKECYLYGINIDSLPQTTPLQRDRYHLAKTASQFIKKPQVPLGKTIIYPEGLSHAQLHFIQHEGLECHTQPVVDPQWVRLRSALNIRSEIESCVQDILSNNIQNAVVAIPNIKDHTALIVSILERYGIHMQFESKTAIDAYLSIVNFLRAPSIHTFKTMLTYNPLNLKYPRSVIDYIHVRDMTYEDLFAPFNHMKPNPNFKDHIKLQERIHEDAAIINNWISSTQNLSYQECLIFAYETLLEHTSLPLHALAAFLEANIDLYTDASHAFFVEHMKALQASTKIEGPITWVDLSDLPFGKIEHLYALNLSAQNYPKVPSRTGVIDESYVSSIAGFPSLDVRTQYILEAASLIFKKSDALTLSYANASYEGKGYELSFVVSSFCEAHGITMKAWPLQEIQRQRKTKHRLSSDLAPRLYLKEGRIKGSISSFQLFVQDPYQYFIERGLRAPEPLGYDFGPMNIGTLNHSIVQFMDTPDYDPWEGVGDVYPITNPYFQMIQRRNHALMQLNLEHLKEATADTDFSVARKEYPFEENQRFPGVFLRGVIDRVDMNDTWAMIIDYKSSETSLSETSVKNMTQLQLLTYALIAAKDFHKPILGVFNYAFRTSNIFVNYASYSFTKGIELDTIQARQRWLAKKRYKGWFFEVPVDHIHSEIYYSGLRVGKNGLAHHGKHYDYEKIETLLVNHYQTLHDLILSGILDTDDLVIDIDTDLSLKKDGETS